MNNCTATDCTCDGEYISPFNTPFTQITADILVIQPVDAQHLVFDFKYANGKALKIIVNKGNISPVKP